MIPTVTIDLRHVARGLSIPLRQVQAVVELLDEGNTVPFITRYRKDHTGGLDEEQIRHIQGRLEKLRQLADRKQTILRSIEAQGKLTDELAEEILAATTPKRLEDLYLPFKPRKQTLATQARERGLETLAREILNADPACADLDARAADFANPDRQVPTGADALLGAGHILAEQFSERADLRQRLRDILLRTGKLVSARIGGEAKPAQRPEAAEAAIASQPSPQTDSAPASPASEPTAPAAEPTTPQPEAASESVPASDPAPSRQPAEEPRAPSELPADASPDAPTPVPTDASAEAETPPAEPDHETRPATTPPPEAGPSGDPGVPGAAGPDAEGDRAAEASPEAASSTPPEPTPPEPTPPEPTPPETAPPETAAPPEAAPPPSTEPQAPFPSADAPSASEPTAAEPSSDAAASSGAPPKPGTAKPRSSRKRSRRSGKAEQKQAKAERALQKRKKLEEQQTKAFRDYFEFSEELRKIPPHRVLAINRGERARVLRVKVEADTDAMHQAIDECLVPEGHPHAEYLRGCARDALARLILPALEREARRELTDKAEAHAVSVFAKNLRNLLLQPPIQAHRVLAVDPGFRSGCKLAALDQFGNVLEHGVIYLVGRPERTELGKQKVVDMVRRFGLSVVAIGNGTACRQTEDFFTELIAGELKDDGVSYVIVNEAGASVYSTSRLGREEFPNYDASLRGAVSIGRRLLDPLSELVKIDPANIGVGLYQHDVRAKHLRTSLDEVVESCVNYVGVEVNTASPALLRYVSGLNQLTARRVYEHRLEHGPFRTREQLRDVPGFGEATFVQAAGFLKIAGGHNPLDATWIHPESYEVAAKVLDRLGAQTDTLAEKETAAALAERARQAKLDEWAAELHVGTMLLNDIVAQLVRPGRDPRDDLPKPIFRHGVMKMEDLTPNMELTGTVLNVVDFGCFVDIGLHDSGLVHVSRLADRFVRDPHEVVAVGDVVKVWVLEIDKERRRVSLTMIPPGTPRERRGAPPSGGAADAGERGAPARRGQRRGGGSAAGGPSRAGGGRGRGKPRDGESSRGGRHSRSAPPEYRPKPRPKPTAPITDEMKAGKEPMRTFSDLLQFYSEKQSEEKPAAKGQKKTKKPAPKTPEAASDAPSSVEPPATEPPPEAQVTQPSQTAPPTEAPQPASPAEPPREDPPKPNPTDQ